MVVGTRTVGLLFAWSGCAGSGPAVDSGDDTVVPTTEDSDRPDTDTDPVAQDSDPPRDTSGEGVADFLRSVSMVVRVKYTFDPFSRSVCEAHWGPESCVDCEAVYRGGGLLFFADGERVTYRGAWELESSTCPPVGRPWSPGASLNDREIWRPSPVSPDAFHTFRVNPDNTRVVEWVTHANRKQGTPLADALSHHQYWLRAEAEDLWEPGTWCQATREVSTSFVDVFSVRAQVHAAFAFSETADAPALRIDGGPPCQDLLTPP